MTVELKQKQKETPIWFTVTLLKQNRKPKLFVSFDAVKKGSTFTQQDYKNINNYNYYYYY